MHLEVLDLFRYVWLNLAAGIAIALDACVLMLASFRHLHDRRTALQWAAMIGLTHATFPLVGFSGGWLWIQAVGQAAAVYLLGALTLGYLVWDVLREPFSESDPASVSVIPAGELRPFSLAGLALIWSVSLDALVTGPGKTSMLEGYPPFLAWFSFALVGGIVALLSLFAGLAAVRLNRWFAEGGNLSSEQLSSALSAALVARVVLFNFFLMLCLERAWLHLSDGAGRAEGDGSVPWWLAPTALAASAAALALPLGAIRRVHAEQARALVIRASSESSARRLRAVGERG